MNSYIGMSDLASSMQLQRNNSSIKSSLFETGQKLATNELSVSEISDAGNIQKLFGFDRSLELIQRHKQATDAGRIRLDSMQTILGNIRDIAANVGLGVLGAVNGSNAGSTIIEANGAVPALESVVSMLNSNIAGQSLFSGAATDRAPLVPAAQIQGDIDAIVAGSPDAVTALAAIDGYFTSPTGGFATTAYTGSASNAPDIRISETERVSVPVRADTSAIRETIRNLTIIAAVANGGFPGSPTDQKTLLLDAANQNLMTSDGLIQLREKTGYDQERLETAAARNEAERSRFMVARIEIANADPYETASKFQELQGQLEKMYTVTSRLSQLTLTNFLR